MNGFGEYKVTEKNNILQTDIAFFCFFVVDYSIRPIGNGIYIPILFTLCVFLHISRMVLQNLLAQGGHVDVCIDFRSAY